MTVNVAVFKFNKSTQKCSPYNACKPLEFEYANILYTVTVYIYIKICNCVWRLFCSLFTAYLFPIAFILNTISQLSLLNHKKKFLE